MFEKKFLAYIIVATVIVLNFLILDNMMISLSIATILFLFIALISNYRKSIWVKHILELF